MKNKYKHLAAIWYCQCKYIYQCEISRLNSTKNSPSSYQTLCNKIHKKNKRNGIIPCIVFLVVGNRAKWCTCT